MSLTKTFKASLITNHSNNYQQENGNFNLEKFSSAFYISTILLSLSLIVLLIEIILNWFNNFNLQIIQRSLD